VILVQAAEDVRRERLRQRGMLTSDVDKRIASQASDEERLAIADFLIRNDGDKDALLRQVENVYEELMAAQIQ
jgi:dephospho-CoA kinase